MPDPDVLKQDVGATVRQPMEEPEEQKAIQVPDDRAAWVISLLYDFENRTCSDLRKRASDAFDQYNGKQWDPAVKQAMQAGGDKKRPCLTFNEIRPKIDALIGEERRNREDWVARPREGSDDSEAQVRTALLKYVRDVNNLAVDESRAFEDLAIGGFGGMVASLSHQVDDPYPQLRIEYRPWRDLRWDWRAKSRNWTDAQWMALSTMVSVDRLREVFPDWGDDIHSEYVALAMDPVQPDIDIGERIGVSRYRDGLMRPGLYNSEEAQVRAVEFYYRTTRTKTVLSIASPNGFLEREVPGDDPSMRRYATELVASGRATERKIEEPAIKGCLVVGRRTLAEWWSPLTGKDAFGRPMFPIFLAFCSDTDGYIMGLVEPMIDPQSEVNKRWSVTVLDYMYRARSGGIYEDGAFENETLEKLMWGSPGHWTKATQGAIAAGKIKEHTPKPTDQAGMTLFEISERTLDRVANMPLARMGQPSQETSGIAIRQRALQSALVQVKAFDNFRNLQLQLGRFVNANLHIMFPVQRTLRLTMPNGETKNVVLNDVQQIAQGAYRVSNSTAPEAFDITMDLTPGNATFREMQAQNLASLLGQIGPAIKNVPQFYPVFMLMLQGLVSSLDGLPNRDKIVSAMDQAVQAAMQGGMGPPGLASPGTPGQPPTGPPGPTGPALGPPPVMPRGPFTPAAAVPTPRGVPVSISALLANAASAMGGPR